MTEIDTQAAPAPLQVRVKKLTWWEWQGEIYGRAPYMMNYRVKPDGDQWSLDTIGTFDTLDAAKAAAQADYERRILSALDLSTPPQIAALEAEIDASPLVAHLQMIAEDPMWADHVEMRKDFVVRLAGHIRRLEGRTERAEAEVARLTEALEPFARLAEYYPSSESDDLPAESIVPNIRDLRRALAALKESTNDNAG